MPIRDVSIESGYRRLAGRIFEPSDPGSARRGVLFIHGKASSQKGYEDRARLVSDHLDAVCLTFDLSGHGGDAANLAHRSVYDHLEDVIAAYDALVSNGTVGRRRVGVSGASYGGYLAALSTAHRVVRRLILRAPSLVEDIVLPAPRRLRIVPEVATIELDSLAVLRRYPGDVLVVESERDEVIPASHIAAYLRACPGATHQIIAGATHALTDPRWDEVFVNAIVEWFRDL
jgi:dienelactone hydrolase